MKSTTTYAGFLVGSMLALTTSGSEAQTPQRPPVSPPPRQDDPAAANRYFLETRGIDRPDLYPWEKIVEAREHNRRMPHWDSTLHRMVTPLFAGGISSWTFLGPSTSGGRTREIVLDPGTPSTMYAAAVSGGVWKSTDSGGSWAALADLMGNLAVCALAMDPVSRNTLYAGTGEGYFNGGAVRGAGIFKTTNGGNDWSQLANTANSNFHYVNDVQVSPLSSSRVYAATSTGIWRSLDSGTSWSQVLAKADGFGCSDLEIRSDQATDHVVVTCGSFGGGEIRRNTDAGGAGTWDVVLDTTTEPNMGRTAIAIAPSAQATMYAVASDRGGPNPTSFGNALHAVFRSTDGGATWQARVRNTDPNAINRSILSYVNSCACSGSCSGQAWYDLAIAVDPVDPQRVWVTGIEAARSDDGGANWGIARGPIHVDMHEVVFHPAYDGSTNKTMYIGTDGGISRTTDARAALTTACAAGSYPFTTQNSGYGVLQFYHGVPYPGGHTYFGGSQDNGTQRGTDPGGPGGWSVLLGGDGAYAAVNPSNTNQLFGSQQNFGLYRSDSGGSGGSWVPKNATYTDNRRFIQPYAMDPNTPTRLWTAGANPWRTDDSGDTWVQRGTFPVANAGREIAAVAVARGNSDRVLIGTTDNKVFGTSNGTAALPTWSDLSTGLGSGQISSIAFDPGSIATIWLTKSTFDGTHVYRSTDGGASWGLRVGTGPTAIPSIPAHSVVVHPTDSAYVYVGTDLGVYVSSDAGATWAVENTGFANVPVEALEFSTLGGSNALYAFTHGRGAWRAIVSIGAQPGEVPGDGTDALRITKATIGSSQVLEIDAGANASALGCGSGVISSWMNRLTPTGTFPMQLNEVRIHFPVQATAGTPIDIFVYRDTDGDGNPSNATLGTRFSTTVTTAGALNTYAVTPPVSLASGDYYVGFTSTPSGTCCHAQLSTPSDGLKSYGTCSDGTNPGSFGTLSSFGYLNSLVIRARVSASVAPGTLVLTWGPPCNAGSVPGQDYAVYRGTLGAPFTYDHASISCAVGGQSLAYVENGSAQYYVVVPRTVAAEGHYGSSIPPAASPCVAQGTPDLCP